jgi:hypothetical protein
VLVDDLAGGASHDEPVAPVPVPMPAAMTGQPAAVTRVAAPAARWSLWDEPDR